jgi:hypothetical protein
MNIKKELLALGTWLEWRTSYRDLFRYNLLAVIVYIDQWQHWFKSPLLFPIYNNVHTSTMFTSYWKYYTEFSFIYYIWIIGEFWIIYSLLLWNIVMN